MGSPFFHEFTRQASFFFKEKIKTARLALTDVTPAQLLTEEATSGDSWTPGAPTMRFISRAAFEVDDYWRIVDILHKRLWKFDKENWRASYKALIILEHLLTHGPERVAEEFQCDKEVIKQMGSFQHVDEKGFNWGMRVREKTERIVKLVNEDKSFLKEERGRARKLTSGIKGFGSFGHRSSSWLDGSLKPSNFEKYLRCNSHYNVRPKQETVEEEEDSASIEGNQGITIKERIGKTEYYHFEDGRNSVAEKLAPKSHSWSSGRDGNENDEDHPFCENEHQPRASFLSSME